MDDSSDGPTVNAPLLMVIRQEPLLCQSSTVVMAIQPCSVTHTFSAWVHHHDTQQVQRSFLYTHTRNHVVCCTHLLTQACSQQAAHVVQRSLNAVKYSHIQLEASTCTRTHGQA